MSSEMRRILVPGVVAGCLLAGCRYEAAGPSESITLARTGPPSLPAAVALPFAFERAQLRLLLGKQLLTLQFEAILGAKTVAN